MSTSSAESSILPQSQSPAELRAQIRLGAWRKQTSGLAPAHVQGNVAILPADLASDFHRFCFSNPKPCPLLAVSETGDPRLPRLGVDLDIRTDVPRYRVFREGEIVDEPYDIRGHWRDDLVTFVIGCSFSFEQALLENGIGIRHIEQDRNVPMASARSMSASFGAPYLPQLADVGMLPCHSISAASVPHICRS
jgi:uncharacterized protein YcsI (UPF0317 family)